VFWELAKIEKAICKNARERVCAMNWDDARIFLAFAREGSFGAAAKRLGVQHSTISRRIHAMESNLAAPLVERSAHGYTLT